MTAEFSSPGGPDHRDPAVDGVDAGRSTWMQRVFFGPHGLRAGWRLALYLLLASVFAAVAVTLLGMAGLTSELAGLTGSLASATAAGWVMLRWVDGRSPQALGFGLDGSVPRDLGVGTLAGGAMLGLSVVLLAVAGTVRWVAEPGTVPEYVAALLSALLFFTVAAALEEVVVRGYPLQVLVQGMGAWPAVLVTSLFFAWLHRQNPGVTPLALANIFLAGVMLSVAYLRTRSLWFATAVHMGWNWTMQSVLAFPVSGLNKFNVPFYDAQETGADWWTGGAFGPEAGLAATVALVAGTVWLARTPRLRPDSRMTARRPLVDARIGERWP